MVERYSMIGRDFGARMDVSSNGAWVRYCDLAAARAEIERLTKARDEALLAQVAAAYELAAQAKVFMPEEGGFLTRVPLLPETKAAIRALTPADAQSALEAYGREKVREGMQRVIDRLRHEGQIKRRWR